MNLKNDMQSITRLTNYRHLKDGFELGKYVKIVKDHEQKYRTGDKGYTGYTANRCKDWWASADMKDYAKTVTVSWWKINFIFLNAPNTETLEKIIL